MKALVIAPRYPVPIVDGHTLRVRHLLANLPASIEYDLVCEEQGPDAQPPFPPAQTVGPGCRSATVVPYAATARARQQTGVAAKIRNVLFPGPLSPGYDLKPALLGEFRRRLETGTYEFVLFMGYSTFLYMEGRQPPLPYLVDMGDSYSLYCRNELGKPAGPAARLRALVNYVWAVRYEQRHCSRVRDLVLITPRDEECLRRHCPRTRTWTLPNGVDCEYFDGGGEPGGGRGLLFTGVMDYEPNVDAMLFFIRAVLPRIRTELPETVLTIAGRNPAPALVAAAAGNPGVRLTGAVEDMRPYFREAAVYVAPMVSGAGLKNKILEAWAMAKPVVATSIACSGLDVREGANVFRADHPGVFGEAVLRILRDGALRRALAAASRRTAEDVYSWKGLGAQLQKMIDRSCATPVCGA